MGVATQQNEGIHAVTKDAQKRVKKSRESGYVFGARLWCKAGTKKIQECEIRQKYFYLVYQ